VSGRILWNPQRDVRERTTLGRYLNWMRDEHGRDFAGWDELWRWSVDDLEGFWASLWEFFDVKASEPYDEVLTTREMPGAKWFTQSRLNYTEHMLGTRDDEDRVAIVARSQTREPMSLTFGELRDQVARARWGLQQLGVGPGDRVVGYLPNVPETVVAFIATASLGATWATCAPEFGSRSVIDRFAQIEPKVLLTVGGYGFRDRYLDRTEEVAKVREALPTVEHVVHVPYGEAVVPDAIEWSELLRYEGPLEFEQVPFDHPLVVLFSSGTTGLPKAIVHGHGNLLVEHFKAHGLQWDVGPEKRLLQFTTTAWMMWNALVSVLILRASIVLIDGDPTWPDLGLQWRLAAETGATHVGMSPAFLMACRKAGLQPGRDLDLSRLKTVITAGSPLPPEGFGFVYDQLGPETLLINGSGGTDVCSAFVTGSPMLPVYEGELAGPALGVDCKAFDEDGNVVVGELGEFVVTTPMPSMPVRLWNDPDGERLREAYFDRYPGVWRQGDWALFTERGSCIITGRSDATLNRGGVRLGTSEIYAAVEELPEIVDSLIVHLEDNEGGAGELVLFVVLADGATLDDDLRAKVRKTLRTELSPRHAPDTIVAVPAVPRTRTGKKLETPVKRILRGAKAEDVAARDALLDPSAIDAFVEYAARDEPANA
jgi:acetoacetyl-CoA synthetase